MVTEVIRRTLSILALLSLLVQAAFGAVSPVAVLCISAHHCDQDDSHQQVVAATMTSCDENRCCVRPALNHTNSQDQMHANEHGGEDRVRIALATPCDDGCADCVDVSLPGEVPAQDVRADGLEVVQLLTAHAAVIERSAFALPLSNVLPTGTGPPDVRGGVDRAIIRTTRLLI